MKKQNFTLTEMLTVIAIIAILAGILIPSVHIARTRSRRTSCLSNQGQLHKIITASMVNDKLYSGTSIADPTTNGVATDGGSWINYLVEKGKLSNLQIARCPVLETTTPETTLSQQSLTECYGVVSAGDAKYFDFRSNKLLTLAGGQKIGANVLAIGACSAKKDNGKLVPYSILNLAGDDDGNVAEVHGSHSNVFFYDGHAAFYNKEEFEAAKIYYPDAADKEAKEVDDGAWAAI